MLLNISPFFFISGTFWFVASKLFTEGLNLPKWSYYAVSIPVFTGFAYCFYVYPHSFWLICTVFLSVTSLIFIAPFIGKPSDTDELWSFHFDIIKHSLYAGIASLILVIGINLVLLAIDYLFGLTPYPAVYTDTSLIICVFILPVMILSGIPTQFEDTTLYIRRIYSFKASIIYNDSSIINLWNHFTCLQSKNYDHSNTSSRQSIIPCCRF